MWPAARPPRRGTPHRGRTEATGDWDLAAEIPTAEARALFADTVARSRAITAGITDLSAPVAAPPREGEPWSIRWVLVHMIEEYNRHLGHADLIREHLDGATGD